MPVKHLLAIVLTMLAIGCGERNPFETKTAHFLVTNNLQFDEVQVEIDDRSTTTLFKKFIYPRLAENFDLDISVPKTAENNYSRYSPTGPDSNSNDWTTDVSVRFRITRTGEVTSWLTCTAGAKLKTRVTIEAIDSKQVRTKCDSIR